MTTNKRTKLSKIVLYLVWERCFPLNRQAKNETFTPYILYYHAMDLDSFWLSYSTLETEWEETQQIKDYISFFLNVTRCYSPFNILALKIFSDLHSSLELLKHFLMQELSQFFNFFFWSWLHAQQEPNREVEIMTLRSTPELRSRIR